MKQLPLVPAGFALVDDDLYDWLSGYRWHLRPDGYAARKMHGGDVLMHRLIARAMPDEQIHHDNDNRLDNQLPNLKTTMLRAHNRIHWAKRGPRSGNYRGVIQARHGSFYGAIRIDGRLKHLGSFRTAEEAASAWNDAAREYWGKDVYQNPVQVPYERLIRRGRSSK